MHRHHRPGAFKALRHLIITFHDETFECACSSWSSGEIEADFTEALQVALAALRTGSVPK